MSTAKEPTTWTACTGDIAFSFPCIEIDLPISVSHHGNSLFSDVLMYVHKTRHSFNLQCAYDEAVGVSITSILMPPYTSWTLKILPCEAMREVSMGIWCALKHSKSILPLRAFRSIFMCTFHPDCLCIQMPMQYVIKSRGERMTCFNIDFKVFISLVIVLTIFLRKTKSFCLQTHNAVPAESKQISYFYSHHCEWFSASDSYIGCCLTLWKA